MKKIAKFFISIIAVVVGLFPAITTPFFVCAENNTTVYEQSDVLDDLEHMTIDGKKFSVDDYTFNELRDVQLISLYEYGYSEDSVGTYNLYVYVFNPKGLVFDEDSAKNKIQFSCGNTNPQKYELKYLDKSETDDKENLFYKFKVCLTDEQKNYIAQSFESVNRTYSVSGIELLTAGELNAVEYSIASKFIYAGAVDSVDGVSCTRDTSEVLELDIHHTYYRPNGSNGTNSYTQDTLMSVYFSIPNEVLDSYDKLSSLECTWIKTLTAWAFVTGNEKIYDEFMKYIGETELYQNVPDSKYPTIITKEPLPYGFVGKSIEGDNVVKYNVPSISAQETITRLTYCFFVEGGIDAADTYILDSDEIRYWIEDYQDDYANDEKYLLVDGRQYKPYSRELFSMPQAYTKYISISADEEYSLTEEIITANWWQKIWGDANLESYTVFNGIKAIQPVIGIDITKSDKQLSDDLYISTQDVKEFKQFYQTETEKNRTVYLFRYDIGTYEAVEVTEGTRDDSGYLIGLKDTDTNARVFRQNIYLDFDVIHVGFDKNGEEIIYSVVSNPTDVIPDADPPLHTTSDKPNWWIIAAIVLVIVGVLAAIFKPVLDLIVILLKGIGYLLYGVGWLLLSPFRLIGYIFELFQGENEKGEEFDEDEGYYE